MRRFSALSFMMGLFVVVSATLTISGGMSPASPMPCASLDEYAVADATGTQSHEWKRPAEGDRQFFDLVYTSSQAPKPGMVKINQIGSFWASKDTDLRGETIDASLAPDAGIGAPVAETRVVHGALKLACGR
jgi:hypothetical protein